MESPDDLLEAGGAHDPVADEMDVDDTTAAELFADLEDIGTADRPALSDERVRDEDRSGDGGLEFAGDPDGTLTVHSESSNETELVGPDPTPTRVTNDAFRSADADMR